MRSKKAASSLSWSAYGSGYLYAGCDRSPEQVPCEQSLSLTLLTRVDRSLISAAMRVRRYGAPGQTVPVGTTIADRPRRESVRARLRIGLLRRMSGVEACVGIGMQDVGLGNPSVQQWGKSFPPHLCSLAAPDKNTPPQPVDTSLEDAQLSRVAGHGEVLVNNPAQQSELHWNWNIP